MPILLLEKDPFVEAMADLGTSHFTGSDANVRRPLLGITPKPNTFAYISLQSADGSSGNMKPVSILDSSAQPSQGNQGNVGYSNYNHNFILHSASIQRQEKTQVIETFGSEYAFFFGQRAQFITFTGMLVNTRDFNWKNEWLRNYDLYLRGTRCVESRSRVFVGFDDVVVGGYVVSTNIEMSQDSPYVVPFSFQVLVASYTDLSANNRSYVQSSNDVRTYPQQDVLGPMALSGAFAEYMTGTKETGARHKFDASEKLVTMSPEGSKAPAAIDYERSAHWLSGVGNTLRQDFDVEDGLKELSIQKYMQESGTDRTTATLTYHKNSDKLSLNTRDNNTEGITAALRSGISNFCGVIGDEYSGS